MGNKLLKAWITSHDGMNVLSLESADPINMPLNTREMHFSARGTKEPRHSLCISFLSDGDLLTLHQVLNDYLFGEQYED